MDLSLSDGWFEQWKQAAKCNLSFEMTSETARPLSVAIEHLSFL